MPRRPVCYVTAPSWPARGPAEQAEMASSLKPLAEAMGWEVRISELAQRSWPGHGAWTDPADRLADLRQALRHEVVWSMRGGFGCIQLLPEALKLRARTPAFCGYSDNTVVHALWWRKGWEEAFYTGRPARAPRGRHLTSLIALMLGHELRCDAKANPGVRPLHDGAAEGRLFVACLTVLAHLCGTPLQPDLRGAILCVEDVDEKPYAIDFALRQLFLSGALRGVRGLVGGFFTYSERADYSGPHVDTVLMRWGRLLGIPVIDRLPFGHIDDHLVLPTGRPARLSVRRGRWSLTVHARSRPPWVAT